jgi:hypothetical protein
LKEESIIVISYHELVDGYIEKINIRDYSFIRMLYIDSQVISMAFNKEKYSSALIEMLKHLHYTSILYIWMSFKITQIKPLIYYIL